MPTFRQDEKLGTKVPLIKTADFNDKSVTTEKLAEGSVTNSKLAPESVTQDKFDKELLQIFKAAVGLPENLIETIQNVDSTLVDHQRQISSNDDDISDLQTKTKQIKDTVDGIAISGGASVGSAVTYDNTQSGLDAQNIQNAIDELVNNLGHYETNEEWLRVYTDAENKFLWGIRVDGSIDWAVGIPKPIQKALNEIIANNESFQQTLTKAMEVYKATIDEKVAAIDEKKVDKEEGKSLIEDEVKECFRVIENEEFIKAIVDSEDKVLFGFYRATGKPYYPQNDMYHISQSEEFLLVILDAANHPLLGIQQDGTCWAAKAQWLDDIKAIKKALKTFQPKEDGKGLINLDVADSFFYISNDEYIIAVVDAENRILAGIKYDGEPYFPNHEMYSVITNVEWLYAIIDAESKVLGGFRSDDGHMIVGGIDISTFIANAIIDITDIKERTAHLSTIVNDEYLYVETDAEGKVIGYIATDGSHYLYKVKSETIPTEFEHIEDPEGRTEITTDAENRIMSYRDSSGKKHEHDMEVTNLDVSNLNLQGNSVNNIQDALKANGFDVKTPIDWSESSFIQIPEPRFAIINVSNIDSMPTTKTDNKKAFLEFWDMQGNYFKKHAILNAQGSSSMRFPKKNVSVDICDDEWIGDETPKVRIGNWVPQDSFHLKAFYTDFFRGVSPVSYKLYEQMVNTRGNMYNRPWKKALIDISNIDNVTKTLGNPYIGDYSLLTDTGARCVPDGFPIALYLNGKFYGVFSWQLKKHRDNYHMNKAKAEHIHLDGKLDAKTIFNGRDNIDWTWFEIRNPKNLYAIGGNKYDADIAQEEIAGDEEIAAWIAAGQLPDGTAITSKIKKDLQLTAKVKNYIMEYADAIPTIKAAREVYNTSGKTEEDLRTFKNVYEKYFDKDNIIDYEIFSDVTDNLDGFSKNWQMITYNGIKWWILPCDCDCTYGAYWSGDCTDPPLTKHLNDNTNMPIGLLNRFYTNELESRYKALADKKVISAENIISNLLEWTMRIGTAFYEEEYKKWKDSPCISDSIVRSAYWKPKVNDNGEYETDTQETFDATKVYNKGDVVSFGIMESMGYFKFECISSTIAQEVNRPHTISEYSPIKEFRHCDNIYRIQKWIVQNTSNMDKLYNYSRN